VSFKAKTGNVRERQATSKRPSMNSAHLFNHYIRASHFPSSFETLNLTLLPKAGKVPKFIQNLRVISFFSTPGRLFDKFVLKTDETPIIERDLELSAV